MVNRAMHESIPWTTIVDTIDTTTTTTTVSPSNNQNDNNDNKDSKDVTDVSSGSTMTTNPVMINDVPVEDIRTLPTLHALLSPYPKSIYGENKKQQEKVQEGGPERGDETKTETKIEGGIVSDVVDMLTPTPSTTKTKTTPTTTATASISGATDTTTLSSKGVNPSKNTQSHRSPLVYIHIYNPVRTYIKQLLQHHFHVSFGDENRENTCLLTPATPLSYHDYISPYQSRKEGGTEGYSDNTVPKHCRTIGLEYFMFRMEEDTVRWLFEKVFSDDVRKFLLDRGIVELSMAEE